MMTSRTTSASTTHEARHVRQLAYALVAGFLDAEGLTETRAAFEREAADVIADLRRGTVALQLASRPLVAVLAEYIEDRVRDELSAATLGSRLRDDESFLCQARGQLLPLEPLESFDTMHTANVLCINTGHLPASLFSSDADAHAVVPVVVTGSTDKTARVAHALTGRLLANAHLPSAILSVELHPSCILPAEAQLPGPLLRERVPQMVPAVLASCMDGTHHLLDVRTGAPARSWKDHAKYVVRAGFSPDGGWILTAGYDRCVNV
ncbi:hypothetical protein HK405_015744, partial [Cladochytrium tenue]